MTSIIQQLADIFKENLFEEKWLIVPNLRIGHQWLDLTAKQGCPVLNVHLKTVSRIARDIIESNSKEETCAFVDTIRGAVILQTLWNDLLECGSEYFRSVTPNLSLFQKLFSSFESIRMAAVNTESIRDDWFETSEKGKDILRFLRRYEDYINNRNWMDRAKTLERAISIYQKNKCAIAREIILIAPDDLELSALEEKFLKVVKEDRFVSLSMPSVLDSAHEPQTDLDLMRWSSNPCDAPEPFGDESVNLFSSVGVTNEIREVFRRCLRNETPLDTVELLYADADTYMPQIFETGVALFTEEIEGPPPVTFADGIPVRYSRPGRLLQCWMDWIRSDYSQSLLIHMLEDGLLEHPIFDDDLLRMDETIRLFRSMVIGSGGDRYALKIHNEIEARSNQIKDLFSLYETIEDSAADYHQRLKDEICILEDLKTAISDWFSATPPQHSGFMETLASFRILFNQFTRCSGELDYNARNRIVDEIDTTSKWIVEFSDASTIDVFDWLEAMSSRLAVLGSGPREGCLHVAGIRNGGHSGRTNTFIVGLNDANFPGSGIQDPFLLDREREKISSNLPISSSHQKTSYDCFYRLLARLTGKLTLGYSCSDLVDDRDCFPSPILLNIYRILSNEREGDPSSLEEWLYPPVSFCPLDSNPFLNEGEWWMSRMVKQSCGYNALEDVERRYSSLHRGLKSLKARLSAEYTHFDGWVPESGKDLDPVLPHGLVMSASKFETLGQCPLRFFFENGLKLKLPEDIEIDPDVWLNPLQFGSLLHEIFETFMQEMIDRKQKPNFDSHWPRLERLVDALAQKYRDYYPPSNQSAFARQYSALHQAAAIFLHDEEELGRSHTPVYVETAVGLPTGKKQRNLNKNPQRITLPNGTTFRARGIIDRVDRVGDESERTYAIWDYKSGGTYKYNRNDPFRQGRIIQHSLYYEMMSEWLKKNVSPESKLVRFGYFFPSEKGKGTRISWSEPELAKRANLFQSLCQIVSNGSYAPTNDANDCAFCDFLDICRNVNAVTKASDEKLKNKENVRLQPFKELRIND